MSNYRSDQLNYARMHGWNVYVVTEKGEAFTKVGTAANVAYRLSGLQNGNPRPLRLVQAWRFESRENAFAVEKEVLRACGEWRCPGRDWMRVKPNKAVEIVEAAILSVGAKLRDAA